MKTVTLIVILTFFLLSGMEAQQYKSPVKTKYAVELNQFITESGFASGSELYVTVMPDHRRTLSFGVYFCPEQGRFSGVTAHHEVALMRRPESRTAVPYLFYNMIYRFTRTGDKTPDDARDVQYGLYKSMEHHIGVGLNVKIAKDFYLKTAAGYGVYFGSIMKPLSPDPLTGEVAGSNGFGAIAKLGLAWIL